ncbi:MAG: MFS transporter [Oscillospiraceae bacterium]
MTNIVLLGLVSFFADIATEMVYPLIPLYLTAAFGATPALIGFIEGIAESLSSLLRVFSGYISDKYKKKKSLAFVGYSTGLIYKIALITATSWVGVLSARVIDRIGKGIRTVPRDVLVSENAKKNQLGKAYGLHQSLDMAGAAVGILLAFFLLNAVSGAGNLDFKWIFLISMIPTVIGLVLIVLVKEKKAEKSDKNPEPFWKGIKKLDSNLKLYIFVAFLFTLGNSSNTFLLLRAKDVGFSDSSAIFLYFIYNITASIFGMPLGRLSDKLGRKKVLIAGYISFALVYAGFAFASSKPMLILSFVLYGIYAAAIKGVEKSFISEISPDELKGTMLGLHATVVGVALLPASVIAGVLWTKFGASAPFLFGAAMALISSIILIILLNRPSVKQMEK